MNDFGKIKEKELTESATMEHWQKYFYVK